LKDYMKWLKKDYDIYWPDDSLVVCASSKSLEGKKWLSIFKSVIEQ
jgi:hypothetical protein